MGNTQTNTTNNSIKIDTKEYITPDHIKCLIKIQTFIKRFLAFKKKRNLFSKVISELKQKIEEGSIEGIQYESKKKLRERVGNLINELIVRDDNSFLFETHFDLICSLQNKYLLWVTDFPLKLESKLIYSTKYSTVGFKSNQVNNSNRKENCMDNLSQESEEKSFIYYLGQVSSNLAITGFGSIVLPGNYVAKGVFINGKIQSPAKIYYPEGLIYEGNNFFLTFYLCIFR